MSSALQPNGEVEFTGRNCQSMFVPADITVADIAEHIEWVICSPKNSKNRDHLTPLCYKLDHASNRFEKDIELVDQDRLVCRECLARYLPRRCWR